jgi:mono/diheme cytochrome c family protein
MARATIIAAGMAVLAGTTVLAGGWAVTTVVSLPDYVVAGTTERISFAVRQHGVHLTGGITNGSVEAHGPGGRRVSFGVQPGKQTGYYTADVTLPAPGAWEIAIRMWDTRRFTISAVAAGSKAPALEASARGARLFAAKGCVSCHVHESFTSEAFPSVGPSLSGKRYAPEFLSAWLAQPRACESGRPCMPKLELDDREIQALTKFIND